MIRLKVRPEVSTLDFGNGITLQGFRIPALSTRRAETNVELRDGQSFAIAGLLDNLTQEDAAAIPILSKIPIIGNLFKSKADRAERTELMVLITPRLVRALDPDEVPPLPTLPRRFLPAPPVGGEKPPAKPGGSGSGQGPSDPKTGFVDGPACAARPQGWECAAIEAIGDDVMKRTRAFISEERGAVLVQVGIAVLVLMAFNVFVIDYGMMWMRSHPGAERRRRRRARRRDRARV